MKFKKILTILVTCLLFSNTGAIYPKHAEGAEIKNFTLPNINGDIVRLSDFQGKKVYIKFWATWCSICLAGISEFVEFNKEKANSADVIVLTIVSPGANGEMNSEDFKGWFKNQGYDFPVLLDEGGIIARQYGIRAYPSSVLINTQGEVIRTVPGHMPNAQLNSLLNGIN